MHLRGRWFSSRRGSPKSLLQFLRSSLLPVRPLPRPGGWFVIAGLIGTAKNPLSSEVVDFAAAFNFKISPIRYLPEVVDFSVANPFSSEVVGFAAAAFEFQIIPNPLSSEAIGFAAVEYP